MEKVERLNLSNKASIFFSKTKLEEFEKKSFQKKRKLDR